MHPDMTPNKIQLSKQVKMVMADPGTGEIREFSCSFNDLNDGKEIKLFKCPFYKVDVIVKEYLRVKNLNCVDSSDKKVLNKIQQLCFWHGAIKKRSSNSARQIFYHLEKSPLFVKTTTGYSMRGYGKVRRFTPKSFSCIPMEFEYL